MFKFRRSLACLAALPLALAAAPSQAQVIFDTTFDSVAVPTGGYLIFGAVEGWTSIAGGGIELQNNAAGSPFSETNLVELDSTSNSTMQRSIVNAGSYLLSFYYSPALGYRCRATASMFSLTVSAFSTSRGLALVQRYGRRGSSTSP